MPDLTRPCRGIGLSLRRALIAPLTLSDSSESLSEAVRLRSATLAEKNR